MTIGARLSEVQRLAGLRLIRSEGIGPATYHDLIRHFGDPEIAIEALPDLSRRAGRRGIRLCSETDAQGELDAIQRHGAQLVAIGEDAFPQALAHIDPPPPFLTVFGSTAALSRPMIAIVGSRNCSVAGRKLAARFSTELSGQDFVISSGLARGIDGAAHEAALSTGTIAVMAGGIDHIYPPEHRDLADKIANSDGALITEMPFGWQPRARDFPRRNRLISGISLGVLVIEAARRSGSLHTARFAAEQGREVFAVPGSPLDPRSDGCNQLIRDGATLAAESAHITDVIRPLIQTPKPSAFTARDAKAEPAPPPPALADEGTREAVIQAMGTVPLSADDLIRHTQLTPQEVQLILLELDIAGRLERHGGGLVSLSP